MFLCEKNKIKFQKKQKKVFLSFNMTLKVLILRRFLLPINPLKGTLERKRQ